MVTGVLTVGVACGDNAPGSKSSTTTVDLAQLDVGNLATQPKPYGKATSIDQGRIVAAMRLGNYVPLPMEIEPEVAYSPAATSGVRLFTDFDSGAISGRMTAPAARLNEAAKGFLSGFVSTGRSSAKPTLSYELDNVVMLFDTEKDAGAAANELAAAEIGTAADSRSVKIGKFPTAQTQTLPDKPGLIRSWYSVGRYVIFTYIYDSVMAELKVVEESKLVSRIEKSIDLISQRVKDFPAPAPDKLTDTDIDLDGMLARALPTVVSDQSQIGIPGVYDRHGGLQLSSYPRGDVKLFEETGVDRVSWKGNFVYRARDAAGAQRIADEHGKLSRYFRRVEPPKGLPFASCREYRGSQAQAIKFYCTVSYDRYATEVAANQLADAHQRVSAQYAILANSK
ncbi:hypothetical protein [Nocardia sp. NPDC052566]|uniref:DUF7373 family lipoprotein n=1 Tax=Nocardia sp. NPDC052566 TaxID=3364330 RepID=UPI0037C76FBE